MAISTQKTVCNKMNNSIQTDKIYLNAMLEVIRWVSNLDQYYRNAVVTKLASNVRLIIGELERESFFAQGDRGRKEKARNSTASKASQPAKRRGIFF